MYNHYINTSLKIPKTKHWFYADPNKKQNNNEKGHLLKQ